MYQYIVEQNGNKISNGNCIEKSDCIEKALENFFDVTAKACKKTEVTAYSFLEMGCSISVEDFEKGIKTTVKVVEI